MNKLQKIFGTEICGSSIIGKGCEFKMKYDALVMVNNQNRETRRKMEERKIKNRIKKFVRKVGLSK